MNEALDIERQIFIDDFIEDRDIDTMPDSGGWAWTIYWGGKPMDSGWCSHEWEVVRDVSDSMEHHAKCAWERQFK